MASSERKSLILEESEKIYSSRLYVCERASQEMFWRDYRAPAAQINVASSSMYFTFIPFLNWFMGVDEKRTNYTTALILLLFIFTQVPATHLWIWEEKKCKRSKNKSLYMYISNMSIQGSTFYLLPCSLWTSDIKSHVIMYHFQPLNQGKYILW